MYCILRVTSYKVPTVICENSNTAGINFVEKYILKHI